VLTTIAILMVGCFVVYAVVVALAFFTGGTRTVPVFAAGLLPQRRVRRRARP
jgi:hypothetical protein